MYLTEKQNKLKVILKGLFKLGATHTFIDRITLVPSKRITNLYIK